MATFDDAFSAAQQKLTESGMLVDSQLLNLADGDKTLAQQIREALIESGLAEDRFGVALALASKEASEEASRRRAAQQRPADPSDEVVFAAAEDDTSASDADWWLMSGGVISGPFDFPTLRRMRGRGEVAGSALVRHTERGTWQRPEEIVGLADVSDLASPTSRSTPATGTKRSHTAQPNLAPPQVQPLIGSNNRDSINPVAPTLSQQNFGNAGMKAQGEAGRRSAAVNVPSPAALDRETSVDKLRRTDKEFSTLQRSSQSAADEPQSTHDQTADETEYFLWDAGKVGSAISRNELEARLRAGRLTADDFVQVGRDGDWQPVSVALSGQRPPLGSQIGVGFRRDAAGDKQDATAEASKSLSSHEMEQFSDRTSPRSSARTYGQTPLPGLRTDSGTTARTSSKGKASTNSEKSSIAQAFDNASDLVGGKGRLWSVLMVLASGAALVVWWQQPPSAGSVYAALEECHQMLAVVGQQKIRGNESSPELVRAESRVRSIRDGLKRRASSQRPAEQELLWACDYGLLPLIREGAVSPESERAYAMHISRAQRLIDPGKVKKLSDLATADSIELEEKEKKGEH